MCTVLLPPGVNPIAVKYIISYHVTKNVASLLMLLYYLLPCTYQFTTSIDVEVLFPTPDQPAHHQDTPTLYLEFGESSKVFPHSPSPHNIPSRLKESSNYIWEFFSCFCLFLSFFIFASRASLFLFFTVLVFSFCEREGQFHTIRFKVPQKK